MASDEVAFSYRDRSVKTAEDLVLTTTLRKIQYKLCDDKEYEQESDEF